MFVRVQVHPRFCFMGHVFGQHVEGGVSVISIVMHQLNEDIRDKEVRLIGSGGEQLGIMSSEDALRIADEKGMDLVKISPQAKPPVCKLMDYGKFRFEQGKREKEARKNQHVVEIKEIRMSPGIDVGDFNVKLKNAQKFLSEGLPTSIRAPSWRAGTCPCSSPPRSKRPMHSREVYVYGRSLIDYAETEEPQRCQEEI